MEKQIANSQSSVSQNNVPPQSNTPIKTVANSTNNTFNPVAITPIIRTIKVSDHCYSIYSTLHKIPLAVHQFIDKTTIVGTASREGKDFYQQRTDDVKDQKFYIDPSYYELTKAAKAPLSYDKGHMAPASNYIGDQKSLDLTYTYANCIPQNSYFNRGSWKNLESYCRNLLRNNLCDTVEVISGPVFYSGAPYNGLSNVYENKQVVLMENGLVVPPKCYKIIKANKDNLSYISAFVLANQKTVDNQIYLKSLMVDLDNLEFMTGLRFNLGNSRPLEQLDSVGMSKTMGDLHLQFYTKMFKNAKTIADMNAARKQGYTYHVKVDKNCLPNQDKIKMAQKDFENIISEKDWTKTKAKARRKINALLGLHRDAKQIDGLSEQLQKNIKAKIQENMEASKTEDEKQYHRWISGKLYKNNYGYHYPCEEQLKALFPNVGQKSQKQEYQDNSQSSQSSQSFEINQSPLRVNQFKDMSQFDSSMKKPKRTHKKLQQNNQSNSTNEKQQGSQNKNQKSQQPVKTKMQKSSDKKVYKPKEKSESKQQNNEQVIKDVTKVTVEQIEIEQQIAKMTIEDKEQPKSEQNQVQTNVVKANEEQNKHID